MQLTRSISRLPPDDRSGITIAGAARGRQASAPGDVRLHGEHVCGRAPVRDTVAIVGRETSVRPRIARTGARVRDVQ